METDRKHAESEGGLNVARRAAMASTLFLSILSGIVFSACVAFAQIAPSVPELSAYVGLHAAAAKGDATEIE
jgi:hypothetical protein